VDLSEDLLNEARAYLTSRGIGNAKFQQGDVYSLDESLGFFDFIYTRFLFQHLADPKKALSKILPRLSPGGRLCVVDIDDAWLTLHPEPAGFHRFTKQAAEGQARNGGDRNVGRKLRTVPDLKKLLTSSSQSESKSGIHAVGGAAS
ncbi:unnamed protein product, partial [marine sediment metagenome]